MAWSLKASYYEACNCALGCSCNMSGFPSDGKCEGTLAFHIHEGNKDGVDLAGAKAAGAAKWPGAIHEGNGTVVIFIDGNPQQQEALAAILTAQDPGLPWEIIAGTMTSVHGPFFEHIDIEDQSGGALVKVGDKLHIQIETFKNPVNGENHEPHMVLKDGFIFQDGVIGTTSTNRLNADGVTFDHPGKNSYRAEVEWSSANRMAPMETAGRF